MKAVTHKYFNTRQFTLMPRSLRLELSKMTDQELDDLHIDLTTSNQGVHLSMRTDEEDARDEQEDVRQELNRSPPMFVGLAERQNYDDSVMRALHDARDQRCLQLPSLEERLSQDMR